MARRILPSDAAAPDPEARLRAEAADAPLAPTRRWEMLAILLALGGVLVLLAATRFPKPPARTVGQGASAPGGGATVAAGRPLRLPPEGEGGATPRGAPAEQPLRLEDLGPVPAGHVRVAAIQFAPRMGEAERNAAVAEALVRRAASLGAQVAALPEACLPGYADPENEIYWSADAGTTDAAGYRDVRAVAELSDGPTVSRFAALADELDLVLAIPFIERVSSDDPHYASSVALAGADGEVLLLARKHRPWAVGDRRWLTPAPPRWPVAETSVGRIGVFLSYDLREAAPALAEKGARIALHVGALVGAEWERYLLRPYAALARRNELHLVLANWTATYAPQWDGYGNSRVVSRDGRRLWRMEDDLASGIVLADLPLGPSPATATVLRRAPTGPFPSLPPIADDESAFSPLREGRVSP